MLYIDIKYINLISVQLDQFKIKKQNPFLANFRCPICLDSQKNKYKARGFLYQKGQKINYSCHNCSASMSFSSFLFDMNKFLYDQYKTEIFLENKPTISAQSAVNKSSNHRNHPEIPDSSSIFSNIPSIDSLSDNHFAREYVENRKMPKDAYSKIFFVENFQQFVNKIIPDKLSDKNAEPRIVLPFFTKEGKLAGFTGRSILPSQRKYITIVLEKDSDKIYGLDKINENERFFVLEGPIDSLFIDNSVAMMGSSNNSSFLQNENAVFVYDNEPRNKEIVQKIQKSIDKNRSVVIFPDHIKEKDINDIVLKYNYSKEEINQLLNDNVFKGIEAKLKLLSWKKC